MKYSAVLFPSAVVASIKHYGYFVTMLAVAIMLAAGCSKDENEGERNVNDQEGNEEYALESVTGKTFLIDGQMFYVTFLSENACKVIPQNEWQTIISSSYVYKAINDNKATLTLSYKDKIVMGTSYTSSDITYDLILNFDSKGKGVVKGGWKSFITVNNGLGSVTQRYASENLDGRAFTLN